VQAYNTHIREFPVNLTAKVFGHKEKPNFTVENERAIQTAPTVDFGAPVATPVPPAPANVSPQPAPSTLPAGPQPVPVPAEQGPQPAPAGG
jgi:LemA protein